MERFNSKVLLFGEYGALYHSQALVMPFDRFSGQLTFTSEGTKNPFAYQSNEYLKKFSRFIASHSDEDFVLEVKAFERELENGLFFQSNIPQGYGLGSSGALVVAIFLRYLKKAKEFKDDIKIITIEKVQQLKGVLAQMESYFHGSSSGLDPLSIILNKPLLYKGANEIAPVIIPAKNAGGENVIFLLNTGIARSTSTMMEHFRHLCEDESFRKKIDNELVQYTNQSITYFLQNDHSFFYEQLDRLITFQLQEMADFIPASYISPVKNGLKSGNYFIKICGAGGGGFMLGFTNNWNKTAEELSELQPHIIYRY